MHSYIYSTSLWFWSLIQNGAIKSKELLQKTGWYKIMKLKLQVPYFIWQLSSVTSCRHSAACVGNGAAWMFFFHGATGSTKSGPPNYRGYTITLDKIPLDKRSALHRDLYFTTHTTHKRETFMLPAGFEPTVPASGWPQTHSLDLAAAGIGRLNRLH